MPGRYVRRDPGTGAVLHLMTEDQAASLFRSYLRGEAVNPGEPRLYRIDARTIGVEGAESRFAWEVDLYEGWSADRPEPSQRLIAAATAAGETLIDFLALPGSAAARWFRVVDGTEPVVPPRKGAWNGECVTPGCDQPARFISLAEAPNTQQPLDRYRCAECCELIDRAAPERPANAYQGVGGDFDEWRAWRARLVPLFGMTRRELEQAPTRDERGERGE